MPVPAKTTKLPPPADAVPPAGGIAPDIVPFVGVAPDTVLFVGSVATVVVTLVGDIVTVVVAALVGCVAATVALEPARSIALPAGGNATTDVLLDLTASAEEVVTVIGLNSEPEPNAELAA